MTTVPAPKETRAISHRSVAAKGVGLGAFRAHGNRKRFPLLPVFLSCLLGCAQSQDKTVSDLELTFGPPVLQVGSLDDSGISFGLISDLAVSPHGEVFVLDRMDARVVQLSSSGELIGEFGRRGPGPGEFLDPIAIQLMAGPGVAVLDLRKLTLTLLSYGSAGLSLDREIQLRQPATSFCATEDLIVINPTTGMHAGQVLDLAGNEIAGVFGLPQTVDPAFDVGLQDRLRDFLRVGRFACTGNGTVFFVPEWNPKVRQAVLAGEEGPAFDLDPFEALRWERRDDGNFLPAVDPALGWAHRNVNLRLVSDEVILVQLMTYGPSGGGRDDPPSEYRVVELRTGTQRRVVESLPLIGGFSQGYAWGFLNTPFPQVEKRPYLVLER